MLQDGVKGADDTFVVVEDGNSSVLRCLDFREEKYFSDAIVRSVLSTVGRSTGYIVLLSV